MLNRVESKLSKETEDVVQDIIGCALTVHRILGPGFKEKIYERACCLELDQAGLSFEAEKAILVPYRQWQIPGHRIDLIVGGVVLVELKAVPRLKRVHTRQVVSYLRATNLQVGLLINFNVPLLKEGLRRIVI